MRKFLVVGLLCACLLSAQPVTPPAGAEKILGSQIAYGSAPWTWFDDRHATLAGWFGGWQTTEAAFDDDWNDALTGTVTTNGTTTIIGSGTTFQTDLCGGVGNTTPSADTIAVVWNSSGAGREPFNIVSCDSQTTLTVGWNYTQANASGLTYSKMAHYNSWGGGSDNRNYYDNVLAFYSLYYRSGTAAYLTYARTLADRWWSMPLMNQGYPINGSQALPARSVGLAGMMLRALDGRSEMWTGIEVWLDSYAAAIVTSANLFDLREQGYQLAFVALGAMVDPTPAKRTSYISALENAITVKWGPQQKPTGEWSTVTFGYKGWDYGNTVTATHGSTTITLSDNQWTSGMFWHIPAVTPNALLFYTDGTPGSGYTLPESVAYTATYVSGNTATLDRPYEGVTGSGKGWQMSNLVGYGTAPFSMGIAATGWYWAYQALEAAKSAHAPAAKQFVLDIANWLTTTGYRPSTKGLYYGRGFPNCEPSPDTMPSSQWCAAEDTVGSRYLSSEVVNAYAAAYLLAADPGVKTQGDILFGAMWGGPGTVGPGADGTYNTEYIDGGWTYSQKKAKNFGFAFGFGLGAGWPAARLTGTSPIGANFGGWLKITGYVSIR